MKRYRVRYKEKTDYKIPEFTKEQKDFLLSLCPDLDFEHMERFSDDD